MSRAWRRRVPETGVLAGAVRRGVLAVAVLAAGVVYPSLAQAGDDDPTPPDFPAVQKPTDKNGGQPDPTPTEWPRVARAEIDAVGDPLPPLWPAPIKG